MASNSVVGSNLEESFRMSCQPMDNQNQVNCINGGVDVIRACRLSRVEDFKTPF